jgi:hypothetical protein
VLHGAGLRARADQRAQAQTADPGRYGGP